MHLSQVHVPFFQDYERRLDLVAEGRTVLSRELVPHHQDWLRMNVYEAEPQGTLMIREGQYGESLWEIDLGQGTVTLLTTGAPTETTLHFLGAFDVDSRNEWRFIPARERGELPLPDWER